MWVVQKFGPMPTQHVPLNACRIFVCNAPPTHDVPRTAHKFVLWKLMLIQPRLVSRVAILLLVATARVVYTALEQPRSSIMPHYDAMYEAAEAIGKFVPWQCVNLLLGSPKTLFVVRVVQVC